MIEAGGTKAEIERIVEATPVYEPGVGTSITEAGTKTTSWNRARDIFPKIPYPWDVLPEPIANSLQQLARSCATSPSALPGAAIAIFASVLGSAISVSPKSSWQEPLIFWFADIRGSGDGKTPSARALCKVLYSAQRQADEAYQRKFDIWNSSSKEDRGPEPARARGYFITDLTLEGLREDLSGHGGVVAVLDEVSALLNSQNQYKGKGSDRESWLALHDGNPFRVVRVGKTKTVSGARLSLFGGIQPDVWARVFGGNDRIYVSDGTVYRFLVTYEGEQFYELTDESWTDDSQAAWENTLLQALDWSDKYVSDPGWETHVLCLDAEAQEIFFDWRNELFSLKPDLPNIFEGFLPKAAGYALRLAGVFYCLNRFSNYKDLGAVLDKQDIRCGIRAAMFYLGHTVDAAQALCSENITPRIEINYQTQHLAETLKALKPELDSGRLAVGYIHEKYNDICRAEYKIKSPHAIGALLRSCGLTIPDRSFTANGRRSVKCLLWDGKTELFVSKDREGRVVCKARNDAGSEMQT